MQYANGLVLRVMIPIRSSCIMQLMKEGFLGFSKMDSIPDIFVMTRHFMETLGEEHIFPMIQEKLILTLLKLLPFITTIVYFNVKLLWEIRKF